MGTLLVVALLCVVLQYFMRTRLGQEMRAVGQDRHIAEVAGIDVDRIRIIAMIFSTVLAAWGQLIFLQNISTLNTYNSHEQVGTLLLLPSWWERDCYKSLHLAGACGPTAVPHPVCGIAPGWSSPAWDPRLANTSGYS